MKVKKLKSAAGRRSFPGGFVKLPVRDAITDTEGLKAALERFAYKPPRGLKNVPWIERLTVKCMTKFPETPNEEEMTLEEFEKLKTNDKLTEKRDTLFNRDDHTQEKAGAFVGKDVTREQIFIESATEAARSGLVRLQALNIPFSRPFDYLAEMLKSDEQMKRIRGKLGKQEEKIEAVEARKAAKELKKRTKKSDSRAAQQKKSQASNEMIRGIEQLRLSRIKMPNSSRPTLDLDATLKSLEGKSKKRTEQIKQARMKKSNNGPDSSIKKKFSKKGAAKKQKYGPKKGLSAI